MQQYIDAMGRGFRADKAGRLNVTYQFQVDGPGGGIWGISIAKGQCTITAGSPSLADVLISMNTDNYQQLAAGQLNVVAAYQAGQIKIIGQPKLALTFTELFPPWAAQTGQPKATLPSRPAQPAPVQPTPTPAQPAPAQPAQPTSPPVQPPPAQPAPAPSQPTPGPPASPAQPVQPAPVQPAPQPVTQPGSPPVSTPTLADYVQAMPKTLRTGNAAGVQIVYQFQLSGSGGGTWRVTVANGAANVTAGAGAAHVTIAMSGANYITLAQGGLNTVQAYQQGRLQIGGDLNWAAKLTDLFAPWANAASGVATPSPAPAQPTPAPAQPAPQPTQPAPAQPPPAPVQPTQPAQPTPQGPVSNVARHVMAMPNGFKPNEVGEHEQIIYEFHLGGDGGETWSVNINKRKCTVSQGRIDDSPTMEIDMSGADFIQLAQGRLNFKQAFKYQQVMVAGELELALKLLKMFNPWAGTIGSPPPLAPPPQPEAPPAQVQTSVGPANPGLLNGSFDKYQPYTRNGKSESWKEPRYPECYGAHWHLNVISEVKSRVHLMDSGVFGKFTQKYFKGGGRDYKMHGRHSQVITGRYGFDLVLYQTVAAQPGRAYTFKGNIVSFYKGTSGERADGKIVKTLGIDPSGGQDHNSAGVVWGNRDGKDNAWRKPAHKVKANSDAITVFIRIENLEKDVGNTELNIIHLDDFRLE